MSSFADTAFAKDVAFSSAAFSFGVAAPTGPEGGVSGYLRDGRKRKRHRSDSIFGDIQIGGNLVPKSVEDVLALRDEQIAEAKRIAQEEEDEIEQLLLHITNFYYD